MPSFTLLRPVEIEFDSIKIVAETRYADEDCPDVPAPFLVGKLLTLTLDLLPDGTARVRDWPAGLAVEIHTKVCDCCSVYLLGDCDRVVASREGDYVPGFMPGKHYGDYVILDIDGDGAVTNWKKRLRDEDFRATFQREE